MDLKRKVSPAVAVIVGLVVVLVVGLLSYQLFGKPSQPQVKVAAPNRADPHFQPDPHIGGGGAG